MSARRKSPGPRQRELAAQASAADEARADDSQNLPAGETSLEDEAALAPMADRRLLVRIWQFVRPHRHLLLFALLLLPAVSALTLLPPYLLKRAIDESIVARALDKLPGFMLLVIVAAVAATLIGRRHRPPQLPPGAE